MAMIPGMGEDPKKIATVIAGGKPKDVSPEGEEDNLGLDTASEEILQALEAKDPKALREALSSFVQMCREQTEMPLAEEPSLEA